MPITYPTTLDSLTNPIGTDLTTSPDHALQHSNANDAVEAIEGELGTDPSGVFATVKARVDANSMWDAEITKASDDNYTSTTTFANDTELLFSVAASAAYVVEYFIIYSGGLNTADYKYRFQFPALSLTRQSQGWYLALNTSDALGLNNTIGGSTTLWASPATGVDSAQSKFLTFGQFTFVTNGSGTVNLQAAQVNLSGSPSKTLIGSRLRYKRLV